MQKIFSPKQPGCWPPTANETHGLKRITPVDELIAKLASSLVDSLYEAVIHCVNNFVDYYKLLHVQRDAPSPIIKASYRAMMQKMQHHPDLGGDEKTAQQLNLAVSVLCNPDKRSQYDQALAQAEFHARPAPASANNTTTGKPSTSSASACDPAAHDPSVNKAKPASSRSAAAGRSAPESSIDSAAVIPMPRNARCPFCKATHSSGKAGSSGYSTSLWCLQCGGAATPIRLQHNIESQEMRQIHRQTHTLPALLWHCWPQAEPLEAMLIDFSPAGCALDCIDAYPARQILKVKTDLFDAICQVCFCKPAAQTGLSMLGLEFMTLNLNSSQGRFLSTSA